MADDQNLRVYRIDQAGVIVDSNPVNNPPGALTKAQNAIADPIGEAGSIRKRPGLKALNSTAATGSVLGGTGVPITLGSAGPNFVNPFTDTNVTLIPRYTFTYKIEPTFNDDSWWFDFDWNFDFEEDEEDVEVPEDPMAANDTFDVSDTFLPPGDETVPRPAAPTLVPFNWFGTTAATGWYLSTDATLVQHVTYPSSFTGEVPQGNVAYPQFGIENIISFAYSSLGGAINIALGSNGRSCSLNNTIYYTADYVSVPTLMAYKGSHTDITYQIRSSNGTPASLITYVLAANAKIYISAWMSGTTTANTALGAVFEYDPATNGRRQLGATFAVDQVPLAMTWAYGRLWVGTASNASSCKLYWMRPDIDTDFTLDNTFAAGEMAVSSLAVFQGQVYAAILNRTAAGTGRLYVRDTLGVYTTSDSGTIDANTAHGNTRGYYDLQVWPAEDSGLTSPVSKLFATRIGMTEDNSTGGIALRRLSGTWATQLSTGAGADLVSSFAVSTSTITPILVSAGAAAYQWSSSGTAWTDSSANLTISASAVFPTFFSQVAGINGVIV